MPHLIRILLTLVAITASSFAADEPVWLSDYQQALNESKAKGKPLLIDFFADWCGPCRVVDRDVLTQKPFIDFAKTNMVLLRITHSMKKTPDELKAVDALMKKFDAYSFPSFRLVSADSSRVESINEWGSSEVFVKALRTNLQKVQSK